MSLDQLLKTYPETCIGCLGEEYNILLDDNATPVVHAPRRVPYALKDKLRQTHD